MSTTVRWGILGTGGIASVFAREVERLDDAEVVAVGSRRAGGATDFAERHGIPRTFDSYEDLVADPGIDLVYVAVPHTGHLDAARLAIRAGKGVLVEKPFTVNTAQAQALIAEAAERGVFLMEAHWSRFLPHMAEIRRVVESGEIGDVRVLTAEYGLRFDPAQDRHRLYDPALGGGTLLDLGVYAVGFVVPFLGENLEVNALGTKTHTGVDADVSAVISDENGRIGVVTSSLATELSNRAQIAGTGGRIEIGYEFMVPRSFEVFAFGRENPSKGHSVRVVEGAVDGHGIRFEAAEAGRAFRAGELESPVMPLALTLRIMRVMDEIRRQIGVVYEADGEVAD